jgi:hypothetical protein
MLFKLSALVALSSLGSVASFGNFEDCSQFYDVEACYSNNCFWHMQWGKCVVNCKTKCDEAVCHHDHATGDCHAKDVICDLYPSETTCVDSSTYGSPCEWDYTNKYCAMKKTGDGTDGGTGGGTEEPCDTFGQTDCPPSRCMWDFDVCMPNTGGTEEPCDTYGEFGCPSPRCVWDIDVCMDAGAF